MKNSDINNSSFENWNKKDLLSIKDFSKEEILFILETAKSYKELNNRPRSKVSVLRGRTVALLFCEPSTRTRVSFELAAKRLSADIINISTNASSLKKGESLLDTAKNMEALNVNTIIVRHFHAGAPALLANSIKASVINAGDGYHEHPTQCLLDLFTIQEKKSSFEGLKVTIIGDILHSRVARSNVWGLLKLGAKVTVCSAPTMIPPGLEEFGVDITYDVKKAIEDADVIHLLRIQFERHSGALFPSVREYGHLFGLGSKFFKELGKDTLIMHPGPINREVEISSEAADSPQSVILEQVTNGLAVRMAALHLTSLGNMDQHNEI